MPAKDIGATYEGSTSSAECYAMEQSHEEPVCCFTDPIESCCSESPQIPQPIAQATSSHHEDIELAM